MLKTSSFLPLVAAVGLVVGCDASYPGHSLSPEEAEALSLNDPQFDGHVASAHVNLNVNPGMSSVVLDAGPSAYDVPVGSLLEPFNVSPNRLPPFGEFEFDLLIDHLVEDCWEDPLSLRLIGTRECMCRMFFEVEDVLGSGLGEIEDGPFEDRVVCPDSLRDVLMPEEEGVDEVNIELRPAQ